MRISAPGKLMLIGEYAVLEGGPALVTAVNRRAHASSAGPPSELTSTDNPGALDFAVLSQEVASALIMAQALTKHYVANFQLDTHELHERGTKLGLGSSAAGAVASAAIAFALAGWDIAKPSVQAQLWEVALRAHQTVAPHGSGADVASAVYGGTLRIERTGGPPNIAAIAWPECLHLSVIWTKVPARTHSFLASLKTMKSNNPDLYQRCSEALIRTSEDFIHHFEMGASQGVKAATQAFGRALDKLGQAASIPIFTPAIRAICLRAEECGGTAKPSGAGGGDVCVAFFEDEASQRAFETRCQRDNFPIVAISCHQQGVRRDKE